MGCKKKAMLASTATKCAKGVNQPKHTTILKHIFFQDCFGTFLPIKPGFVAPRIKRLVFYPLTLGQAV